MTDIINFAKTRLSRERFIHSKGVMEIALQLGKIYKVPQDKLEVAAILHDIAKEMSYEDMLSYLEKYNIKLGDEDIECKGIIHGFVSALIAKERFNIDEEIYNTIFYHSTGHKDFGIFGKIIFAADYLDPSRKLHKQKKILKIIKKDLNYGVVLVIKEKINYLIQEKGAINHNTVEFYNSMIRKIKVD
ncbi:MAG: bis(5'-nucleosyl)-tetraphosphatase (symmetrical) YqeK [Brevinematales bacterium]|nr:bis(5'-nucleosyl)-tetraphosphatase (symmetrical) YqeK [Brevinematales bacterium]